MKKLLALGFTFFAASLLASNAAFGQLLFSENFDDGMASTRWTANNPGSNTFDGVSPMDTNFDLDADGVTDDISGFSFDYSTIGIPSAPNSTGTAIGLKMQANLFFGAFGGFSVSPNSQSFTGDYVLSYDMWQNFNGPLDSGFNGTTNISYGGIMSSGTAPNMAGIADGVWFASTGDGDSGADYRAYSFERQFSYQSPPADDIDMHANYIAGSRNNTADLYRLNINPEPDPVGAPGVGEVTAPAAQLALFPQQTGTLRAGAMGFAWYHHEITKEGNIITWSVDGLDLIQIDLTNTTETPGGENILFGHGDISAGSSSDPNAQFLLFTLVDNVEVNVLNVVAEDADFDNDDDVDGRDFLIWQRGFGTPDAQPADGDADGDMDVDGDDLVIWQGQYAGGGAPAVTAVPEPGSLTMLLGVSSLLGLRRRTRNILKC